MPPPHIDPNLQKGTDGNFVIRKIALVNGVMRAKVSNLSMLPRVECHVTFCEAENANDVMKAMDRDARLLHRLIPDNIPPPLSFLQYHGRGRKMWCALSQWMRMSDAIPPPDFLIPVINTLHRGSTQSPVERGKFGSKHVRYDGTVGQWGTGLHDTWAACFKEGLRQTI
ncbi:hypothetical protein QBC41DRAFT_376662 [Cercophora samala]|uniref:Uncharacterized protein n=1 Tax=Cercophora samala TaxID=330535 RepID=A0AA39Z1N7_9PEZI|nr:hypothetical protein QBC41DRAFT_376662 [Cercophora samala]